jgi:hypothetical protein
MSAAVHYTMSLHQRNRMVTNEFFISSMTIAGPTLNIQLAAQMRF